MIGIVIFGLITTGLGLWMILKPKVWLDLSVRYCRLPYMHPLEILLRLGFGFIFVIFSAETRYPTIILYAGYLLIAVGIGLAFLRPSYHSSHWYHHDSTHWAMVQVHRVGGLVHRTISDLRRNLSAACDLRSVDPGPLIPSICHLPDLAAPCGAR